jgi:hypothetical protein
MEGVTEKRKGYLTNLGFILDHKATNSEFDDASYYHGHGIFSDIVIDYFCLIIYSDDEWEDIISPIKVIIRDDIINKILD